MDYGASNDRNDKLPVRYFFLGEVHITEWIKICFAGVALMLAINEFLIKNRNLEIKNREIEVERLRNSADFLLKGNNRSVQEAIRSSMKYATDRQLKADKAADVIADLSPLYQHLTAWAHCIASGLCDRASSLRFLCGRVDAYEYSVKKIFKKVALPYDRTRRDLAYSGMLSNCTFFLKKQTG